MSTLLLKNISQLVTCDDNDRLLTNVDLYCEDGFIKAIGPELAVTADETIGRDATEFFRNMQLENASNNYDILSVAPLQIKPGIIEAFIALGASPWQIITRVLLRESRSSLILALTTAAVSLIGATAMAGTVGAGGLGHLAIRNGYQSYDLAVMNATIIVLFILVQLLQSAGNTLARKLRR